MASIFNYVLCKIKERFVIFISLIITFLVGFLLGLFFNLPEVLREFYTSFVFEIFTNVLLANTSIFNFLFLRIINLILLYLIAFLLSLNFISFFGVFIMVFYRSYVLAVALKICAITLTFGGIIPFIFTVFLESLIVTFSLIIYAVLSYKSLQNKRSNFLEKQLKKTTICLLLGVVGIVAECLLLACVFRPINFYF